MSQTLSGRSTSRIGEIVHNWKASLRPGDAAVHILLALFFAAFLTDLDMNLRYREWFAGVQARRIRILHGCHTRLPDIQHRPPLERPVRPRSLRLAAAQAVPAGICGAGHLEPSPMDPPSRCSAHRRVNRRDTALRLRRSRVPAASGADAAEAGEPICGPRSCSTV